MAFETKIKKARFAFVGYSGQQMKTVADATIARAILPRIQAGLTVDGTPAKALSPRYARVKGRKHPPAIRNWVFTGRTLRSMKTLTAQLGQAVIGFTDGPSNMRASINNTRSRQFGAGSREQGVISEEFAKLPSFVKAVSE